MFACHPDEISTHWEKGTFMRVKKEVDKCEMQDKQESKRAKLSVFELFELQLENSLFQQNQQNT